MAAAGGTGLPDEVDDFHRGVYDWEDEPDDRNEQHGRGLDFGLLVLRVGALLLLPHGVAKAQDIGGFTDQVASNIVGGAAPELIAWLVLTGQTALPVLLAVGLFARAAAFLVTAMMAAVWGLAIVTRLDYRALDASGGLTGESALLYVALTLPLLFTGAGRWSLDAMRTGGRP